MYTLRNRLNDLFVKAGKNKPLYFNTLANELKSGGKVKKIFYLTEQYIAGLITIEDIKKAMRKKTKGRKPFKRVDKPKRPGAWIVKKR